MQSVTGTLSSPRLPRRGSPFLPSKARQRLTLRGLPIATVTDSDVDKGGSQLGLNSLNVPYADDEEDEETPATTPTTDCPTPMSALPPPPGTPSTPGQTWQDTPITPGPTAEELYHMMVARTQSSRRRRPGWYSSRRPQAWRMSQLESRFAAADRLRRSRSPRPSPSRLPSDPQAVPADRSSSGAGQDQAVVSSSTSSMSLRHGLGPTPPHSARPRCSTGDREAFKWSLSSEGDRKLSSASQLPNVVIDDSIVDAQVRQTSNLHLAQL